MTANRREPMHLRQGMHLPGDRVDLWLAPVPLSDEVPSACNRWLSREERWRADGLLRPTARRQRLVAYAARRAILSFYAPSDPGSWQFVEGVHGRPELIPPPGVPALRVSLSDTEGLVAVVVAATADVGVDIERVDPRRRGLEIAERCFAPEESAALRAASAETRPALFATFWTLKESYLKARGVGVWGGVGLDGFRFELIDEGHDVLFASTTAAEDAPGEWRFFTLAPTANHRGAVAVRGATGTPRLTAFALADTLDAFSSLPVKQREPLLADR